MGIKKRYPRVDEVPQNLHLALDALAHLFLDFDGFGVAAVLDKPQLLHFEALF